MSSTAQTGLIGLMVWRSDKPKVSECSQTLGPTLTFITMMLYVTFGPNVSINTQCQNIGRSYPSMLRVKAKVGLICKHNSVLDTMLNLSKYHVPFMYDGMDIIIGALKVTSQYTVTQYYEAYKVESLKDTLNYLFDKPWPISYDCSDYICVNCYKQGLSYNKVRVGNILLYCDVEKRMYCITQEAFEKDYEQC